jgi:hypothetical protein
MALSNCRDRERMSILLNELFDDNKKKGKKKIIPPKLNDGEKTDVPSSAAAGQKAFVYFTNEVCQQIEYGLAPQDVVVRRILQEASPLLLMS